VPRPLVVPVVELRGATVELPAIASPAAPPAGPDAPAPEPAPAPVAPGPTRTVPLRWLARGRSGDKGNTANIGILARSPELVPVLRAQLTADRVKQFLTHLVHGEVRRHEWPGLAGWNFVCSDALGGGGIASLRFDPQGKALAQILLELPIEVPASLAVTDPEAG
jgi:hypothetical protein